MKIISPGSSSKSGSKSGSKSTSPSNKFSPLNNENINKQQSKFSAIVL